MMGWARVPTFGIQARSLLGRIVAIAGACAFLAIPAGAAEYPLPTDAYPPHTRITYFPQWTNGQFDCNFGWTCEGSSQEPMLHMMTQDQLHRTNGWALWGEWHGDSMGFELYSSEYEETPAPDPGTWGGYAAGDEERTLARVQKARAAKTIPSVLPPGARGGAFAYYLDRPYWHAFFLTAWWGSSHEVEAAVLYPKKKKWVARRYLIKQVRAAVKVAEAG